jgi:hypothetical protein
MPCYPWQAIGSISGRHFNEYVRVGVRALFA